jgi:hypothetical protein
MLPVGPEKPSDSASLMPCRSIARRASGLSRRSAQGDPATHSLGNIRKSTPLVRIAVRVSPGVRRTSSAIGPFRK